MDAQQRRSVILQFFKGAVLYIDDRLAGAVADVISDKTRLFPSSEHEQEQSPRKMT